MKKCLSSILLLYIVLMMMPIAEATDTTNGAGTVITPENFIEYGDFQVSTEDIAPTYASNKLTFSNSGSYYLKMKDGVTSTSDQIIVDGCTIELTVEDVHVTIPGDESKCAFQLKNASTVTMSLVGNNKFVSGGSYAGVSVTSEETLIIEGSGVLRAKGAFASAGIGGSGIDGQVTAGTIIINSGTVYAEADADNSGGAGIGAGSAGQSEPGIGGVGSIIINGGNITAKGGIFGAGIGSSRGTGSISIKNANVKAYGGESYCSGIGSGYDSENISIFIENSKILAVSGQYAAGIGTGYMSQDTLSLVEIDDQSEVIAVSDSYYNNAIDADTINVGGHMLMATYKNIVAADSKTSVMKDGKEVVSYTPSGDYKSIALTLPSSGDYAFYNDSGLQTYSDLENMDFKVETSGLTTFDSVQEMKISDYKIITEIISKLEKLSVEDMLQAEVDDAELIQNKIKEKAVTLANNKAVVISVNELDYKKAVAGSNENGHGTNGYYEFTITATKGNEIQNTHSQKIVIIATPYVESPTYRVEGGIEDDLGKQIQNATVRIMNGKEHVGASIQTDEEGKFVISAIPNGRYNIVVTKEESISTTTMAVDDANYAAGIIVLPSGKKNSTVEIKDNTPSIVVGGLEKQFQASTVSDHDKDKGLTTADNSVIAAGGSVEIKFVAEKKDETASNAASIATKASSNNSVIGLYLDFSVEKIVKNALGVQDDSLSSKMDEVPTLIDVFIPLESELQNKSDYKVYRYHGSDVDVITTTENADHEKMEIIDHGSMLKISVKKFSTYAIAYANPTSSSHNHSSRSTESKDDDEVLPVKNDKITIGQSSGGMITKLSNDKTVNIRPDQGYLIADVIVDGMSIGAVEQKVFTDDNKHHITATFVEANTLPYYMQDGKKIYIGFSNIHEKSYNYIAPSNSKVEFDNHPISLEDNTLTWAEDSIKFVVERELLDVDGNQLGINEKVTRAEFITVIGQLYERSYGKISAHMVFEDVDMNTDSADYLAWAYQVGIIKGVGNNKFAPDDYLTREQMAVIVNRFMTFLDKESKPVYGMNYQDQNQISDWASDSVAYCCSEELIPERYHDLYKPQEEVTRAEVAVTVHRVIKKIME